mgnify:CR=1 FL=1
MTTEQIVTSLLSSNEILYKKHSNINFTSNIELNKYLNKSDTNSLTLDNEKNTSGYLFIKSKWEI